MYTYCINLCTEIFFITITIRIFKSLKVHNRFIAYKRRCIFHIRVWSEKNRLKCFYRAILLAYYEVYIKIYAYLFMKMVGQNDEAKILGENTGVKTVRQKLLGQF